MGKLLLLLSLAGCSQTHNIKYLDKVEFTSGFYEGRSGVVVDIMPWSIYSHVCYVRLDINNVVVYDKCVRLELSTASRMSLKLDVDKPH